MRVRLSRVRVPLLLNLLVFSDRLFDGIFIDMNLAFRRSQLRARTLCFCRKAPVRPYHDMAAVEGVVDIVFLLFIHIYIGRHALGVWARQGGRHSVHMYRRNSCF